MLFWISFILILVGVFSLENCTIAEFPMDYYRILPAMVPEQFQEVYEVIEIPQSTGALCLDGTNYKFYLTHGEGTGQNKFMFFFQGAGYCGADGMEFLASCLVRVTTEYGSSSEWGDNGTYATDNQGWGYFSSNRNHNPKFWNWNKVLIKYCDGSNNQGYLEDPINYNGTDLWFRGYNNTFSVFEYAKTYLGLFEASDVIVAGGSSGAVSAMIWIQFLKNYLPASVKLSGLSDGGLLVDFYNTVAGCHLYKHNMEILTNFTRSEALDLFKTCKYYNTSDIWKCLTPEYFFESIQSPFFFANAIYDCDEMATTYGIPCVVYGANTCGPQDKENLIRFQQKFLKVILNLKKNMPKWGFWARSCFEHTYYSTWAWYGESMNTFSAENYKDQNLKKSYYNWYSNIEENYTLSTFIDMEDWLHNPNCVKK